VWGAIENTAVREERQFMIEPMDPLPTSPDDPRLDHWYHTIELAPGIVTRAHFDHRTTVDLVGLPESLKGKTVLDVGTADGFWAFELERRGADKVTAIELARWGDIDLLPQYRARFSEEQLNDNPAHRRFATAHKMLGSKVEHKKLNIYDLRPETIGGTFDVLYCGSLLLHLRDPAKALMNMRTVCKETLVIETASYHPDALEAQFPDLPLMMFGRVAAEGEDVGSSVTYWSFSTRALCDMLLYAGFSWVEPLDPFVMKTGTNPGGLMVHPVVAHVAPNPELKGFYKTKPKPEPVPVSRIDPPQPQTAPVANKSRVRRIIDKVVSRG
jgi:tRNA (mo5U34)-methyltransferase